MVICYMVVDNQNKDGDKVIYLISISVYLVIFEN